MRIYVRVLTDTVKANESIKSGKMGEMLVDFMQTVKPEYAFFTADDGVRCFNFLVDMKDVAEVPMICERFFVGLGGRISLTPAMVMDDVGRGLAGAADEIKKWS